MKDTLFDKVSGKMKTMMGNVQINLNEKMNIMHGHLQELNLMLNSGCDAQQQVLTTGQSTTTDNDDANQYISSSSNKNGDSGSSSSSSSFSSNGGEEGDSCRQPTINGKKKNVDDVLHKLSEGIDILDYWESSTGTEKVGILKVMQKYFHFFFFQFLSLFFSLSLFLHLSFFS
jgi:hypothetical protein